MSGRNEICRSFGTRCSVAAKRMVYRLPEIGCKEGGKVYDDGTLRAGLKTIGDNSRVSSACPLLLPARGRAVNRSRKSEVLRGPHHDYPEVIMGRSSLGLLTDTVLAFFAATGLGGVASMITGRNLTVAINIFGVALVGFLLVFWFGPFERVRHVFRVLCGLALIMFCLIYLWIRLA